MHTDRYNKIELASLQGILTFFQLKAFKMTMKNLEEEKNSCSILKKGRA